MTIPTLTKDMTMFEAFRRVATARPNQEALVCGEVRLTYGELLERIERLAGGLYHLGIHKGDHVAALLSPGIDLATLFFAVAKLGAVIVPLNPQWRRRALQSVLRHAQPTLLVTEQVLEEELLTEEERPRLIVYAGADRSRKPHLGDLLVGTPVAPPWEVTPQDLFALLYTSGTTGMPKATMHTHRSLIAPVVATLKIRELWMRRPSLKTIGDVGKAVVRYRRRLLRAIGQPQVFLSISGWHNTTGLEVLLQALLMGDKLVVLPQFEPRAVMRLIEKEKITVLAAVPMVFQVLLSLPDFDQYDTSSLLICGTGAAPCPPHLAREIRRRFGCSLHIGFGTSETGGGIAATSLVDSADIQAETVGRPMPGMEVKIVDDQRRELPPGQVGELAIRSDSVMQGYYQAPELTAQVLDADGWFYTGDLAVIDEKGYLRIVGRKKDMIIRGGQNVYPTDIEACLVAHPKIREAAVVGIPATVGDEHIVAFIILKEGATMTAREALEHCRAELETYQIPSRVYFVEDFPRSDNGKPQKFRLREIALELEQAGQTGKEVKRVD